MQYDTPVTPEEVNNSLANDPNISTETRQQIEQILGTTPDGGATQVNVGTFDGTNLQAPPDQPVDLLIIAPPPPPVPGQIVQIQIPTEVMQQANAYVFQTTENIQVVFNSVERVIASGSGNDNITVNGDKNTTLDGAVGSDTLVTSGGNDSVTGGAGNDSISTGAGNDTIVAAHGADTVDGGAGLDIITMVSGGGVYDYTYEIVDGQLVVNSLVDPNNSVVAKNTEIVSFGEYDNVVVGSDQEIVTALRMYEGLLGRTADLTGAQAWIQRMEDGMTAKEVTQGFLDSAEYQSKGINTNEYFVDVLYMYALDRAPDAVGRAKWLNDLNTGSSKADVAMGIVGSDEANLASDFTYLIPGQV